MTDRRRVGNAIPVDADLIEVGRRVTEVPTRLISYVNRIRAAAMVAISRTDESL